MEAERDRIDSILRVLRLLRREATEAKQPMLAYLIEVALLEAMEIQQPKRPPT
jgi:hypothetical protein